MNTEQENLIDIFKKLKILLKKYEGPFTSKWDLDSKYDLWSIKDILIQNRKRKEVYFAGLIIQSNYVGFYYMPIYADINLAKVFGKELLQTLKGKSCFHIKKLDTTLLKQIEKALKVGFSLYKKRGWV